MGSEVTQKDNDQAKPAVTKGGNLTISKIASSPAASAVTITSGIKQEAIQIKPSASFADILFVIPMSTAISNEDLVKLKGTGAKASVFVSYNGAILEFSDGVVDAGSTVTELKIAVNKSKVPKKFLLNISASAELFYDAEMPTPKPEGATVVMVKGKERLQKTIGTFAVNFGNKNPDYDWVLRTEKNRTELNMSELLEWGQSTAKIDALPALPDNPTNPSAPAPIINTTNFKVTAEELSINFSKATFNLVVKSAGEIKITDNIKLTGATLEISYDFDSRVENFIEK